MRQKYVISRNELENRLKISEYAIIDKNFDKVISPNLQNGNYSFIGEESYESEAVVSAISQGLGAVVSTLRTHNIFPIQPYAIEIAESVTTLYNSSEDDSVELFFDDVDLLPIVSKP